VSAQPPAMAGAAFLAKPGLILEEQPDPLAGMRLGGRGQRCGQILF
jgi:hypothetical protein